jgi:hypothetical protein
MEGKHEDDKAETSGEPSHHAMELDNRVLLKDVKGSEGEMKAMEPVTTTEGEREEEVETSREPFYRAIDVDDRVAGKDVKSSEGKMNEKSKGKVKATELVMLEEEGRQGNPLEEFYKLTFDDSLLDPAPIPPVMVKIWPVPSLVSKAA